jgi:hypothetical protein
MANSVFNTKHSNQLRIVYWYLQNHLATASMVSKETGIPQKNICRYKRSLEQAGVLFEVKKSICKETGFKAWYLSTNSKTEKLNKQLNLF